MPFSASRGLHYAAPPSENGNRRPADEGADGPDASTESTTANAEGAAVPADD